MAKTELRKRKIGSTILVKTSLSIPQHMKLYAKARKSGMTQEQYLNKLIVNALNGK